MQLNKIPATIVTGFLGSGKTTLLASVLKRAAGKRIAVIVNEFGELDIDAELLRSCPLDNCALEGEGEKPVPAGPEKGIYELANGCICCTVEEEFLPVMKQLMERRQDIDHILIETSGLALPKPLVQAFNWPEIKQYCTVDAVITVIDGPAVAAGRYAQDEEKEPSAGLDKLEPSAGLDKLKAQRLADENLDHDPSLQELLDDQLGAADLVVVSKNDLLDAAARQAVADLVAARVPAAVKTLYLENGEVEADLLLGVDAGAEQRIDALHTHHDHHHQHGSHHEHAHDHFESCVVTLGEVDGDKLQKSIRALLAQYPVYRAKGFAALPGKPMRQVLQAVGERLDSYYDRLWRPDEARATQLVFIGRAIDATALREALAAARSTP